ANFAFRADVLRELGGFDEALGAGTPTGGGDDLDAFLRVLLAGHALAYEPAALVWHSHRADLEQLRQQMFNYGSGLSAYLTKYVLAAGTRRRLLAALPAGVTHLRGLSERAALADGVAEDTPALARGLRLRKL
nr:glycosyltransferase [Micromonospora sp. DSM 115978]